MITINTPAAPGGVGFFAGTAALGYLDATAVSAAWLTSQQQELLAILTAAGVQPDQAGANMSQVLQALTTLFASGRRIGAPTKFSVSGAYAIPDAGSLFEIRYGAAGGGGGGTEGQGSGQAAIAGGGSGGAVGVAWLTRAQLLAAANPDRTLGITVGAGGLGGLPGRNNGGRGGDTSLGGGLLSAPGGTGGLYGAGHTDNTIVGQAPPGDLPSGPGLIYASAGGQGMTGFMFSPASNYYGVSGGGGSSALGVGGGQVGGNTNGLAGGTSAGGSGANTAPSGPGSTGGAGGNGLVVINAYS